MISKVEGCATPGHSLIVYCSSMLFRVAREGEECAMMTPNPSSMTAHELIYVPFFLKTLPHASQSIRFVLPCDLGFMNGHVIAV